MVCGRRCIRALIVAGVLASGAAGGCGDGESRPPLLQDVLPEEDAGGSTGDSSVFAIPPPPEPTCNLGPEGGVCACVDEPLEIVDPPTMYFVLDTSGSMADDDKWRNVQIVIQNLVTSIGPRAKFAAATFPNERSTDECAAGGEVFPPTQGDSPAGTEGPTAKSLLSVLGAIQAFGGTPTAATLTALTPRVLSLPGTKYVILATDGGPNCDDAVACDASECQLNIESTPISSTTACSPSGPDCCTPDTAGYDSCLDAQPTIDAVTALAAGGVPVFVVGAPGSEPYAALLDELAEAGGTALSGEPEYYAVDTSDTSAFTTALSSVAAKITATCVFQLNQPPESPDLVNVFLDEEVLPQAGPDGWTLSGSTVTILGSSCTEIQNGSILDVRVVAGCPTDLVFH